MWIYDEIMFVHCAQFCEDVWRLDVILYFVNPTFYVANKLTYYLLSCRFDRRWQMDVELALTGSSMECYYRRFLSITTATHVRHALI